MRTCYIVIVFYITLALLSSRILMAEGLANKQAKNVNQTNTHLSNKHQIKLANTYFKQKNYKKVIQVLEPIISSLSSKHLIKLADAYHQNKDFEKEKQTLNVLLVQQPDNYFLLFRLARLQIKNKDNQDKTIELLRKIIALKPQFEAAYVELRNIFLYSDNLYELINITTEIIEKFGTNQKRQTHLCMAYTKKNYIREGLIYCQKAISSHIKNPLPEHFVYLAQNYKKNLEEEKALNWLKKALVKFPKSDFVYHSLAEEYEKRKNPQLAAIHYDKATKLNPKSFSSQKGKARAYFDAKNYKKSLEGWIQACRLNKSQTLSEFKVRASKLKKERHPLQTQYSLGIQKYCR